MMNFFVLSLIGFVCSQNLALFNQLCCFLIKARSVQPETGLEQYMVSPITGEKIPASKVPEHMRIGG